MMRVALIESGRRALFIARALREQGHEAAILTPQTEALPSTPQSAAAWQAEGLAWIPVGSARLEPPENHFPRDRSLAVARSLADIVQAFDVAWFFECHWAMPALRERRFRVRLLPLIVLDAEPDPDPVPASLEEMNRAGSRRYAMRHADLICNSRGFSSEQDEAPRNVRQVEELWRQRTAGPAREMRCASTSPAVTVCIPYFEVPDLLPETLQSLERQTCQDFTVVVVDDGSPSEGGRSGFDACAERYAQLGWKFIRQENLFPGAARNRAAREAESEFLLFLDADDIASPAMMERFLSAALLSGDDCLVAPNYGFREDPEWPRDLIYDPPGCSLAASMADDMHGGSCIFVRREAFRSIGGFTEMRGVNFEDYEFHVRMNLEGFRCDVLPEPVYRYRMPGPGNVSRSTLPYPSQARVNRWYEQRLRGTGLELLPLAVTGAFRWGKELAAKGAEQRAEHVVLWPKRRPAQGLRLLLVTSGFPFGGHSGWHSRVREMIRYFGSRYELTLVTPAQTEGHVRARREAFPDLHALREVGWAERYTAGSEALPASVHARCRAPMQAALRAIPTDHYHAALIDMVFMAEFRHDIDTLPVLTEHNIESQILRRAGGHSEAAGLEGYENRTWPDFPLRAVVSEEDRTLMDRRVNAGRTVVAANGADVSRWIKSARHDTNTVLFAAHLGYLPNMDAVEFLLSAIWPEVRRKSPRARLIVAGRLPGEALRAAIAGTSGVELLANPASMDKIARRASLTVAPLRVGSGTRIKILESMAWGLPVISTAVGCEGIGAIDGEHLLIRDDPRDFAGAIVELMSDAALWRKLRSAGRELVCERYSWDRVFQPLEEALLDLVS